MSVKKWNWGYVYEELAAAFSGEVAPGVFFEVVNYDAPAAECRVYLRVPELNGGYTYKLISTRGLQGTGFVALMLDEYIALEIGWPSENSRISFVTDREEMHDLCVQARASDALAFLVGKLSAEVDSLESRIRGLLKDLGVDDENKRNNVRVREFLRKNCLEVTSE